MTIDWLLWRDFCRDMGVMALFFVVLIFAITYDDEPEGRKETE